MTRRFNDPTSKLVDVDWDDPRLQDLLQKIEGLRLDNRGTFKARPVRLHLGWHVISGPDSSGVPVTVVGDSGPGGLVIKTDFPLQPGEPVTLDRRLATGVGSLLQCDVERCKSGSRPEDQGHGVFISWLRVHRTR
uniref:PilZ domain-containing protein n=1 Tax=mine drainage metagenome TaxID=410659 RepID=E6PPP3_9ZZZZ